MNIFLNEYFGFCFELNFELNHFSARFNEKMNFQNVSYRAILESLLDLVIATQGLGMCMGGAPAGTGKTETVKDMAKVGKSPL